MKEFHTRAGQVHERINAVKRYHELTKHQFFRFAPGPASLDWANQPDPFRRYKGCQFIALPRLRTGDAPVSPPYDDLYRAEAIASAALTASSLSRFLECSLAITAWKQAGGVRWALRANPSSGNLHPTEAYLLLDRLAGVAPVPGLYHYAVREHGLELRAEWPPEVFTSLLQGFPPGAFFLGFTSVHWREAWKYGERAFRYCQHDLGHAIGSACLAARMLGWRMLLLEGLDDDTLATLLGVDRAADFEGAEQEHPGGLAVVWPGCASLAVRGSSSVPRFISRPVMHDELPCVWHGRASRLSRDEAVRWDGLDDVAAASWKSAQERGVVGLNQDADPAQAPAAGIGQGRPGAAQVMRQRRSALDFDGRTSMPAARFFDLLARTMPCAEREPGRRPPPWDVLPWVATIDLALFVHRVDGLAPGLYMLAREPSRVESLRRATYKNYA